MTGESYENSGVARQTLRRDSFGSLNDRLCNVKVLELFLVARSFQSQLDEEAKKRLSGACYQGLSVLTAKGLLENAPALKTAW